MLSLLSRNQVIKRAFSNNTTQVAEGGQTFLSGILIPEVVSSSLKAGLAGVTTLYISATYYNPHEQDKLEKMEKIQDKKFAVIDAKFEHMEKAQDMKFAVIDAKFEKMERIQDKKFAVIDAKFEHMEKAQDKKFAAIDTKFENIDNKIDKKMERIAESITQLRLDISKLGSGYQNPQQKITENPKP